MDIAEVDASGEVWIAVCVKKSFPVGFWQVDKFIGRDNVSVKIAAKVCL